TAMIMGIVGAALSVLGCLYCAPIGIISGGLGIAAVSCGFVGLGKAKQSGNSSVRSKALTGVITGFVAIAFGVLSILTIIFNLAMLGMDNQQFNQF
ncbi:MAG: hypothetical protein ACREJB_17350, partial [Planctomycetaceae bacterium]